MIGQPAFPELYILSFLGVGAIYALIKTLYVCAKEFRLGMLDAGLYGRRAAPVPRDYDDLYWPPDERRPVTNRIKRSCARSRI